MAQGVRSRVACLSGKAQTTSTWRAPSNPPQEVEPHRDQSVWEHCSQSGYWESRVPGAGGRAGMAGQGWQGTPAHSSAPAHVHPVPRSLPLLSFTSVRVGLRSPCTVGCGLQSAAPTRPFRGILGCPSKGQPTPLELAVRSTGNSGHSGTEGLPGVSWWGVVGSDCGEGTRPNAPWSAPWAAPPCPSLAHRLLDGPPASCAGSPEVCVGRGLLLSASANCTPLQARPLPSILKASTLPGPLQPQTASAGIESLP